MTALEKRLEALEQRNRPVGENVVITFQADVSQEDHDRGMAEAEVAAGPYGLIICVEYDPVKRPDWWGPEHDEMERSRPSMPPYRIRTSDQRTWGPGD